VKDAARALKKQSKDVFMPLLHLPGEAQMDFGQALVRMAEVLRKVSFLAMALPHSDAMFVMAFERSPHASGAYPGSQRRELSAAAVQAAAETPGQV